MSELTVVCALFRGKKWLPHRRLYDEQWVNKLYRGFARNLNAPFRFLCLTNHPAGKFEEAITLVPFKVHSHRCDYMCMTEIFRHDLGIDRGLFCGLDTIVCKNVDAVLDYDGPLAMPRNPVRRARGVAAFHNGVVLWRGEAMAPLWERYVNNVELETNFAIAPPRWRRLKGKPSEMLYWQNRSPVEIEPLNEALPHVVISNFTTCRKNGNLRKAHILYYGGKAKPSNTLDEPVVRENWM